LIFLDTDACVERDFFSPDDSTLAEEIPKTFKGTYYQCPLVALVVVDAVHHFWLAKAWMRHTWLVLLLLISV